MTRKFTFIQDNGEAFPEWEEKALGKILHEPKKEAVSDPSQSELVTVKLYGKGIERTGKFPNKTANARPYYIRNQGELLIGRQNFHNGGMGILPSDLDGLIASNAISSYTLIEEVKKQSSMEFIHFLISRKDFYSKVDKLIGGTGQKELSRSEFNKLRIPLPSLPEQQKIAEFFSALDDRIALTADKVKLLKEQKVGYLQKIFAQEIAFTDDNGDKYPEWEQKKFTEVLETVPTKKYQIFTKDMKPEGKFEVVDQGKSQVAGYSDDAAKLFTQVPAIVYGDHTTTVKFRKESFIVGADGTKVLVAKDTNLSEFLFHALCHYNVESEGYKRHYSILKDISLPLPSLLEQEKIAEFFTALDEQIELTENKLALLKEQKKGYLQGIFG